MLLVFMFLGMAPLAPENACSGSALGTAGLRDGILAAGPNFSLPSVGKIRFTPFGRLGYRKVGWSARVPFPYSVEFGASSDLFREFYRIRMPAVDMWLAEGGVDALLAGNATLGLRISGNILQDVLNTWLPESRSSAERSLWRSRNFSWTEVDFYAIKPVHGSFCLKSGLRYDDFRLAFKEPYEIRNISEGGNASVDFRAYQASSHIWAPYLGLGWDGPRLKAFLTASVFGPSSISMQSRMSANIPGASNFSCYTTFSSSKPASCLDMSIEYAVDIPYGLSFRIWGKSGWMQVAGKGDISSDCLHNSHVKKPVDDALHLTFTRIDGAAGLSINLTF